MSTILLCEVREGEWIAQLEDDPTCTETGTSPFMALGCFIVRRGKELGITVETPKRRDTPIARQRHRTIVPARVVQGIIEPPAPKKKSVPQWAIDLVKQRQKT